ncbi:MAG: restriction endonuclease subunit S [Tepidanaerobacteraceae bacterium]|jgi:type I restriction enzyme S subunit
MVIEQSGQLLGDLIETKIHKKHISNEEEITFIAMEDVSEDGKIINESIIKYSEVKKGLTYFEKDDVLVAKITPCFENSKGACLDKLKTEKGFGSTEFHVLRAKSNAEPKYIFYHTQLKKFRKQLEKEMTGSAGQRRVPMYSIINYPLDIKHTLTEQKAIAKVLSDVDELIISIEKLIDKKQKIKQGTMQLLLTGKKRLPGFTGGWEVGKVKDLLYYERPEKYIESEIDEDKHGLIPVLTANKAFILGTTNNEFNCYIDLPVILFDDFTVESKYVDFIFKVRSSAIKILKSKENANIKFIYYLMQIIPFNVGDHKRYYISEYQEINVNVPPLQEQKAIAQILSDMDSEIEALQQKFEKYKLIKEGMMEKLLTGKVRLNE